MDLVCYIIELDNGKFKPFLSMIVDDDGDDDNALYVSASKDSMDTLEQAQTFIKDKSPPFVKIFLNPIKPSFGGITWLSELEEANRPEQV